MFTRRTILAVLAASALSSAALPARAADPVFAVEGIAIRGFDPVVYHLYSEAAEGSADFTSEYMGATFRFVAEETKAAFDADPVAYAPAYGGYCAYAMAQGALAATDPMAWTIYNGRLYFNASLAVRDLWQEDIPGYVAKADANWPGVLD